MNPQFSQHSSPTNNTQYPAMRFGYVVLLAVATLITSTEAKSTRAQTLVASQDTHHLRVIEEEGTPAQRHLRTTHTHAEEDQEERGGYKDIMEKAMKKLNKLAKYNKWSFGNRLPEWVKANCPAFAKGYEIFWNNRMVRVRVDL
ncbi:unnamed protein product [Phytophthora lilii]|uniref:RxLR effector protein n=1 Tax=Phytophthora lilii TaxID=2077276 RepID=A0A9W6XI35_9STRA|nr:unnamed protein product [Phytophthora lilii]